MTDAELDVLIEKAKTASENAYCPYSEYQVGAALITGNGNIFTGCNVENVSFGMSMCAERIAVFKAVSAGDGDVKAIVVYHENGYAYPCGACLQVIAEFNKKAEIVLACDSGTQEFTLRELLPYAFDSDEV